MSSTRTNRFLKKIPQIILCESGSESKQRSQVFLNNYLPSIPCEDLRERPGHKHARDEQSVASSSQSLSPHSSPPVPSPKRVKHTGAAGVGEVGAREPQVCAEVDKLVSLTAEETELRTRKNESAASPIGARGTASLEGDAGVVQGQREQHPQTSNGATPVHLAAREGHAAVTEELLAPKLLAPKLLAPTAPLYTTGGGAEGARHANDCASNVLKTPSERHTERDRNRDQVLHALLPDSEGGVTPSGGGAPQSGVDEGASQENERTNTACKIFVGGLPLFFWMSLV
jgi:hypothetical protein